MYNWVHCCMSRLFGDVRIWRIATPKCVYIGAASVTCGEVDLRPLWSRVESTCVLCVRVTERVCCMRWNAWVSVIGCL